jgi:hypothetical protein
MPIPKTTQPPSVFVDYARQKIVFFVEEYCVELHPDDAGRFRSRLYDAERDLENAMANKP